LYRIVKHKQIPAINQNNDLELEVIIAKMTTDVLDAGL